MTTGPLDAPTELSSDNDRALAFTRAGYALSGLVGVFLAVAVTPDVVARYLSPDNQLGQTTAAAIDLLRTLTALLAAGLLLLALQKRWAPRSVRAIVDGNLDAWPWAVLAVGVSGLLIAIGFAIAAATNTRIGLLLSDPNAVAGMPFYYGALEYAGIVLMAATAGIAIFSSTLSTGRNARFLLLGGLLTLLYVTDDLYMLHEQSARLDLSARTIYAIYAALGSAFVATNWKRFLQTPFSLLFTAAAFFAASTLVDSLTALGRRLPNGFENMLGLIGICFWSAYFIKCCRNALRSRPSASSITQTTPE
jgi:hypothetical protein